MCDMNNFYPIYLKLLKGHKNGPGLGIKKDKESLTIIFIRFCSKPIKLCEVTVSRH